MKRLIFVLLIIICFVISASARMSVIQLGGGQSCVYDDYFHAINATYWTETDASGDLAISSGELRFDSEGTAEISAYITSNWYFAQSADFDIQVEFNDISWTSGEADQELTMAALEITNAGETVWCHIGRRITSSSTEQYVYRGSDTVLAAINNTAASGKFRVTSVSDTITVYYWDAGESRWEWNDNAAGATMSEDFSGGTVYVRLYFKKDNNAAGNTAVVDFDNFTVETGCRSITLP